MPTAHTRAQVLTEVSETGNFVTTSGTDTVIGGLSVTPEAGTYYVLLSTSAQLDANNADAEFSVYGGGVQVAASERRIARAGGPTSGTIQAVTCVAPKVTVDGAQAVEARVRVSAGGVTVHERTLTLLPVL